MTDGQRQIDRTRPLSHQLDDARQPVSPRHQRVNSAGAKRHQDRPLSQGRLPRSLTPGLHTVAQRLVPTADDKAVHLRAPRVYPMCTLRAPRVHPAPTRLTSGRAPAADAPAPGARGAAATGQSQGHFPKVRLPLRWPLPWVQPTLERHRRDLRSEHLRCFRCAWGIRAGAPCAPPTWGPDTPDSGVHRVSWTPYADTCTHTHTHRYTDTHTPVDAEGWEHFWGVIMHFHCGGLAP